MPRKEMVEGLFKGFFFFFFFFAGRWGGAAGHRVRLLFQVTARLPRHQARKCTMCMLSRSLWHPAVFLSSRTPGGHPWHHLIHVLQSNSEDFPSSLLPFPSGAPDAPAKTTRLPSGRRSPVPHVVIHDPGSRPPNLPPRPQACMELFERLLAGEKG